MHVESLTRREVEVLQQLANGARVKLIAKRLFISETTVRGHLRNIFTKLDVHSQAELVERLDSIPGVVKRDDESTNAVVDQFDEINQRISAIVQAASAGLAPLSIKETIRSALPLNNQLKNDWATFFRVWALDSSEDGVDDARDRGHAQFLRLARNIVRDYQSKGIIRDELDPAQVVETLYGLTISAAGQILFKDTAGTRDEQLRMIDAYIDSIVS